MNRYVDKMKKATLLIDIEKVLKGNVVENSEKQEQLLVANDVVQIGKYSFDLPARRSPQELEEVYCH